MAVMIRKSYQHGKATDEGQLREYSIPDSYRNNGFMAVREIFIGFHNNKL
jgi:hypothetical protein